MGRTRLERALAELGKRIQQCEKDKKKLLDYANQIKNQYLNKEITYSEYKRLLNQKIENKTIQEWVESYDLHIKSSKEEIRKHKKKSRTKKILVVSLSLAFILILLFSAFYLRPIIVGLIVQEQVQEVSQVLSLEFSQSQDYEWSPRYSGQLKSAKISGTIYGEGEVKIYLDDLLILDSSNIEGRKLSLTGNVITGLVSQESYSEIEEAHPSERSEEPAVSSPSQEQEEPLSSETEPSIPSEPVEEPALPSEPSEEVNITLQENITTPEELEKEVEVTIKEFENVCEETCNLSLNKSSYKLRIELSDAKLELDSIKYEILTKEEIEEVPENITESEQPAENITEINITELNVTLPFNITEINITTNATITTLQYQAKIGQTVKWKKSIELKQPEIIKIKLPKQAKNITVNKIIEISQESYSEIEEAHPSERSEEPAVSSPSQEQEEPLSSETGEEVSITENQATEIEIPKEETSEEAGKLEEMSKKVEELEKEIEELKKEIEQEAEEEQKATEETAEIIKQEAKASITGGITGEAVAESGEKSIIRSVLDFFRKIFSVITGRAVTTEETSESKWTSLASEEAEEIEITIDDNATKYEVEYETPAPQAFEKEISEKKKQITISAPDELNYTNILAYTELPTEAPAEKIHLYHLAEQGREEVNITKYDLNNNSLIDYVEWVVPHLSNQTYELEIVIINAEHLNKKREFIANIYNYVNETDNLTYTIPKDEYVRAYFERNLTNKNFIDVYVRNTEPATIEVYEKDSDVIIGRIENVLEGRYYISLNLTGSQSVFDMKSVNDVVYDYIHDQALSGYPTGVFFEDYESGSLTTNGWEIGAGTEVFAIMARGNPGNSMSTDNTDAVHNATVNVSTVGYYDIWLTVDFRVSGMEAGEYGAIWWYNGSKWDLLFKNITTNGDTYMKLSFNLTKNSTSANNNPNLRIRFTNWANANNDYVDVDNVNVTGTAFLDTVYPSFSTYWDNNASLTGSGIALFNVTVLNTNGTVFLEINNTNITARNLSANVYNASYSFTANGTYTYRWHSWGNGAGKNYNKSEDRSYTVNATPPDTIYPTFNAFNSTPGNASNYASEQVYQFNSTVINTNGTVGLEFNGTNYTALNLTASVYNVTRNGLAAGTYSYYWWGFGNGTGKNFNKTQTYYYTVNKTTPQGNLTNTTPLAVTYGTEINVSWKESNTGDGDVAYKIYRNNADVTGEKGLNVTLGVGGYDYILNTTGGQNYTSNFSMSNFTITINQATGVINGTINGTQGNFSAINGSATQNIYINATNITGYGTGKIYVNGSLYNSGTMPLFNVTNLSVGFYNITFEYDGNTNYTSDTDVWWVNITAVTADNIYPNFSGYWSNNATLIDSGIGLFNVTVTSTNGTVFLEINNTNITARNLSANVYNASYAFSLNGTYTYRWHSWGNGTSKNYNKSEDRYYTVNADTTAPDINFTNPTPSNGATQNYNSIFVNVTANDSASNISTFIDFDNSLAGWWRMDDINSSGDVVDYTGKNNGTAYGDAQQTTAGKLGKGFAFDGKGDYVSIPDSDSFSIGSAGLTISLWVKPTSLPPASAYNRMWIIGKNNFDSAQSEWELYLNGDTKNFGKYNFAIWGPGDTSNSIASNTSAVAGQTVHIAVTIANNSNLTIPNIYINGVLDNNDSEFSSLSSIVPSAAPVEIGRLLYGGSELEYNWTGTIDDVMIFNRSLSAEEIRALYANTSSRYLGVNYTGLSNGAHTFKAYTQDLAGNVNATEKRTVTLDFVYPSFFNYWDNNASLVDFGTGLFNVTVTNTNGTVLLEIDGQNITARNLSANVYNASYVLVNDGTYTYRWHSWGNGTAKNYNKSEDRSYTVNVTAANVPPQITHVFNESMTDVSGGLNQGPFFTSVIINFTAYDANGASDLNDSSAKINFTKSGEDTRQNLTCQKTASSGSYANYTCNVTMWWWDAAGSWNIAAYIEDNNSNSAQNTSTTFQVGPTTGFEISPAILEWAGIAAGSVNQTSNNDPLLLNNTGNVDVNINTIQINATNLRGEINNELALWAGNFSVGITEGGTPPAECRATIMNASAFTNITGASLPKGNYTKDDGTAQEQLYVCLKIAGRELTTQPYSTSQEGAWTIQILFAALAIKGIRKTRKKKVKSLIYNLSIPSTIFSKRLGFLEGITKYMKENLGMSYHKIAILLNRDERTIWTAYHKSVEKQQKAIEVKETEIFLPISIFNEKLTILESIIVYLKQKGLRYSEIARLLDRDQRNIWLVYSRAIKKFQEERFKNSARLD